MRDQFQPPYLFDSITTDARKPGCSYVRTRSIRTAKNNGYYYYLASRKSTRIICTQSSFLLPSFGSKIKGKNAFLILSFSRISVISGRSKTAIKKETREGVFTQNKKKLKRIERANTTRAMTHPYQKASTSDFRIVSRHSQSAQYRNKLQLSFIVSWSLF